MTSAAKQSRGGRTGRNGARVRCWWQLSQRARGWAMPLSTSSYIFSLLREERGARTHTRTFQTRVNHTFFFSLLMLDYVTYITSVQEHYSKKRGTHFAVYLYYKFCISPGCCHTLTVLVHAARNSWAMWFLRFYFRAAAVKHTALLVALGIVGKIKSFNPAVWFFFF